MKLSKELAEALAFLPDKESRVDYLATLQLFRHGIPIIGIELGSLLRFVAASDPMRSENGWVAQRFGDVLEGEPFLVDDRTADRDLVVGALRRTPPPDPDDKTPKLLPSACRVGRCSHREHREGDGTDSRLMVRSEKPLPIPSVGWSALTADRMMAHISKTMGVMPEYERTAMNRLIGLIWALQYVRSRQTPGVAKSVVNLPPQVGKSTVAHAQTLWMLSTAKGRLQVITASHSDNLAVLRGVFVREILGEHNNGLSVTVASDDAARDKWRTVDPSGYIIGGLRSVGIGSKISGHPADAMLLDDLADGVQDAIGAKGESVWRTVSSSLAQRLQSRAWLSVLATRWAAGDVPGRYLDLEGQDFCQVVIPAVHDDPKFDDPLGRELGEVAVPERFTLAQTHQRIRVLGGLESPLAQALYQQKPAAISAGHFRREMWGMVSLDPADLLYLARGWDLAGTEGGGDATAGVLVGVTVDGQVCIVDIFHDRLGTGGVREAMRRVAEADADSWDVPLVHTIEQQPGAAGLDMRMTQESLLDDVVDLEFVKPSGSKVARAYAASSRQLVGGLFISDRVPAAHIQTLVKESEAFPGAAHDDIVDALAMAVNTVLFNPPRRTAGSLTTSAATRI